MKRVATTWLLVTCVLLAFCCVGCESRGEESLPIVCVTIQPQRLFAENLAGDRFDIYCMLSSSGCADEVDPAVFSSGWLEECMAYLTIGGVACEQGCVDSLLQHNLRMAVYDTTEGVDTLSSGYAWCSPKQAKLIATNMYHIFVELDPSYKEYYKKRYDVLMQELKAADSYLSKKLESLSHHTTFAIDAPSLSYLARDYGLSQVCVSDSVKAYSTAVCAVLLQEEEDRAEAEQLAKSQGCSVVQIAPLTYEWFEGIENIANALTDHVVMLDDTPLQEKQL